MTAAIGYLRASTNETLQKNSIDIQKAIIINFAKTYGYIVERFYIEYETGSNDNRAEFNKALRHSIKENTVLISWKVDRLSRSLSIFNKIQDHLHLLRFAELGNTTPNIMVLSVLLGVAHQERINTSERVKATYKMLKEKDPNHKWGDPNMATNAQPIGVIVRKKNAKEFNTKIQGICADLKRAGYTTLKELSAKLNDIGLTTRRGAQFNVHNLHRVLNYQG
tara:strand:+ start:309 stop:974 length:666 start_codon:yes stop_codon:yes gene_type:complete